jgi:hypothetical protein
MLHCRLSYVVLAVLMLASSAIAGVPSTINVQGRLTDAAGTPLSSGFKQLTFSIHDAEAGGSTLWAGETQLVTTDADGLWNAAIGAQAPLSSAVFADDAELCNIRILNRFHARSVSRLAAHPPRPMTRMSPVTYPAQVPTVL